MNYGGSRLDYMPNDLQVERFRPNAIVSEQNCVETIENLGYVYDSLYQDLYWSARQRTDPNKYFPDIQALMRYLGDISTESRPAWIYVHPVTTVPETTHAGTVLPGDDMVYSIFTESERPSRYTGELSRGESIAQDFST